MKSFLVKFKIFISSAVIVKKGMVSFKVTSNFVVTRSVTINEAGMIFLLKLFLKLYKIDFTNNYKSYFKFPELLIAF